MSTKKILIIVNAITSLSLIVGLLNNSVIAFLFGLSSLLDSYFTAIVIPMMFMYLFVDFVGKNFLPVYSEEKKKGDVEAKVDGRCHHKQKCEDTCKRKKNKYAGKKCTCNWNCLCDEQ